MAAETKSDSPDVKRVDDAVAKVHDAAKQAATNAGKAVAGGTGVTTPEVTEFPKLATCDLDAYYYDKARGVVHEKIPGVIIDGMRFERATGYDFMLMRIAAAMDGIPLELTDSYRTMDQQIDVFNKRWVRQYPSITLAEQYAGKNTLSREGEIKGQAGYPGTSNHQSGRAIDIDVGLSKAQFASRRGIVNDKYIWLTKNAPFFGFDNDEVISEPWHWRHKPKEIIGRIEGLKITGLTEAELASLKTASSIPGARRFDLLNAYTQLKAGERTAANQSRQALLALAAGGHLARSANAAQKKAFSVLRSTNTYAASGLIPPSTRGGAPTRTGTAPTATSGPLPPRGMVEGTENEAFDFTTGLWGDGNLV